MKCKILSVSLMVHLLTACGGEDSGLLNPPTEAISLTASPQILQLKVNQKQTVDLRSSVTAVGIDQWRLVKVSDEAGLGEINNLTAHTFDYEATSQGVSALDYTVEGGHKTASSQVLMAVLDDHQGDNTAPVAQDLILKTKSNQRLEIELKNSITDADGDSLTISHLVSSSGRFHQSSVNTVTFTPNGFVGIDSAAYSVDDGRGGYDVAYLVVTSEEANPTLPNTTPIAKDFDHSLNAIQTPMWTLDLSEANLIADADNDALSVVTIYSSNGRTSFQGHKITYTPNDFVGVDQFTYVVSDGKGGYAAGTVTVTVSRDMATNASPQAQPVMVSMSDSITTPHLISVNERVSDPDGDELALVYLSGAKGKAELNPDNPLEIKYTPNGTTTEDRISYVVSDGKGGFAMSVVMVTLVSENPNAPVARIAKVETQSDRAVSVDLSSYLSDAETETAQLMVSNLSHAIAPGQATLTGQTVTYEPNGFVGLETLTYTVSDGKHHTQGIVAIASNVTYTLVAGDITTSIDLATQKGAVELDWRSHVSSGIDGNTYTLVEASGALLGSVSTDGGRLLYEPIAGKYGTDQFIYKVSDAQQPAHYAQGMVSVTILPPDAPEITQLKITGAPIVDQMLSAEVVCERCDASRYQYSWIVNGLTKGVASDYTYRVEDVGFNLRLEVVGVDAYGQQTKKETTYAIKPRNAKQIVYTFDRVNTGILYQSGVFKTKGSAPGVADQEVANIKKVVPNSNGFLLIDNNNEVSALGGVGSPYVDNTDVLQVVSTAKAAAILKNSGSVVAWGAPNYGGDIPANVKPYTEKVTSIIHSYWGFAVIDAKGNAASWGDSLYNQTDTPETNGDLTGIKKVLSTGHTWFGIKEEGGLVRWGSYNDKPEYVQFNDIQPEFKDVTALAWGDNVYIALNSDGSAVSWGEKADGAVGKILLPEEVKVVKVAALDTAVLALGSNGNLYTWGNVDAPVTSPLNNIKQFVENNHAVATLDASGAVQTFGDPNYGGSGPELSSGVIELLAGDNGFVALKKDGSAISWGNFDIPPPPSLNDVVFVERVGELFFAHQSNGEIISWGSSQLPGRSAMEDALSFRFEQLN